jgi:hypothetical protein
MLGVFAYIGACLVVAILFTIVTSMFRPIQKQGDARVWRPLLAAFVICLALPYVYNDVLTRVLGADMEPAIDQVLGELKVEGELNYYRVVSTTGSTARVVAVATEHMDWGGTERPVIAISLERNGSEWEAVSYSVVNSLERNEDSYTLPPYY